MLLLYKLLWLCRECLYNIAPQGEITLLYPSHKTKPSVLPDRATQGSVLVLFRGIVRVKIRKVKVVEQASVEVVELREISRKVSQA